MQLLKYYVEIIHHPINSLIILINIIITEIILSIDNAIIIASIIIKLKKKYRTQAIKYGIISAYVFRGICLGLTTFIVKIWWLKPLSGIYLIIIGLNFLKNEYTNNNQSNQSNNWLNKITNKLLGNFWSHIISIELIDIAFSIDNILASIAFSNNLLIILIGVFTSILTTRCISHNIIKSIEKYSFIKKYGFIIIIFLGIKLIMSYYKHNIISIILHNNIFETLFCLITISIISIHILLQNNHTK
jgi:YkoY family integral membrane protein